MYEAWKLSNFTQDGVEREITLGLAGNTGDDGYMISLSFGNSCPGTYGLMWESPLCAVITIN